MGRCGGGHSTTFFARGCGSCSHGRPLRGRQDFSRGSVSQRQRRLGLRTWPGSQGWPLYCTSTVLCGWGASTLARADQGLAESSNTSAKLRPTSPDAPRTRSTVCAFFDPVALRAQRFHLDGLVGVTSQRTRSPMSRNSHTMSTFYQCKVFYFYCLFSFSVLMKPRETSQFQDHICLLSIFHFHYESQLISVILIFCTIKPKWG